MAEAENVRLQRKKHTPKKPKQMPNKTNKQQIEKSQEKSNETRTPRKLLGIHGGSAEQLILAHDFQSELTERPWPARLFPSRSLDQTWRI